MNIDWKERILAFVDEGEPESSTLEFKSGDELQKKGEAGERKKTEISKDVSAMANAGGGVIIYGIKTEKRDGLDRASTIVPVDPKEYSRDWLTQVIKERIHPNSIRFAIEVVDLTERGGIAFAVQVDQALEPYQAYDHRFYQRIETQTFPMRPNQIDDIRRRMSAPDLFLDIGFIGQPNPRQRVYELTPSRNSKPIEVFCKIGNRAPVAASNATILLMVTGFPSSVGIRTTRAKSTRRNPYDRECDEMTVLNWSVFSGDPPLIHGIKYDLVEALILQLPENRNTNMIMDWEVFAPNMVRKTGRLVFRLPRLGAVEIVDSEQEPTSNAQLVGH